MPFLKDLAFIWSITLMVYIGYLKSIENLVKFENILGFYYLYNVSYLSKK